MSVRLKMAGFAGAFLLLGLALAVSRPILAGEANVDPTMGETAWGSFVADAMRDHYKCDAAFIDAGTLSTLATKEVVSSDVTRLEIAEVEVVLAKMTGRELAVALNNSLRFYPRKNNGFLQVSGIVITIDPALKDAKVVAATLGGAPVNPDKVYTVALTKFLANGGASFNVLDEIKVVDGTAQFVGDLIKAHYEVNPDMPKPGTRYVVRNAG